MKRKLPTLGILLIVLIGISIPNIAVAASPFSFGHLFQIVSNVTFGPLLASVGYVLMTLSSLILTFCGWIFDTVIQYTIIELSENIGEGSSMGATITSTWATLRDIANMCFIFVLLYAAFKAMFDTNFGNFQTTVKNIIIVALLINFSLFFSKVVIDASNIVSVGFYNSIASNNAELGDTSRGGSANFKGISGGYMRMLGLQTWYSPNILDAGIDAQNILIVGMMSSVFMLTSAILFLVTGIMFAARFIILVFLMILSPLALIAYIIPGQKGKFDEWKDALIAQSFFAPVYFALTWVAFNLGNSLLTPNLKTTFVDLVKDPTKDQVGAMSLLLNYVLVMGFGIAALIISKSMASKTAGFKAISGGIGAVALGGTALAGRNLVGRASSLVSEKYRDQWSKTAGGRAGLWLANKGKNASFDVRGLAETGVGKAMGAGNVLDSGVFGKTSGKGGFAKSVEEKAKKKAAYGKDVYGQTEKEKEEFEKRKNAEKARVMNERATKEATARREAKEAESRRKVYIDRETNTHTETLKELSTESRAKEQELKRAKTAGDTARVEELNKELGAISTRIVNEREAKKERQKEIEDTDETYQKLKEEADEKKEAAKKAKEQLKKKDVDDDELSPETQRIKSLGKERQEAYAERLEGKFGLGLAGDVAAARAIKKQVKEKSKAEKLADAAKDYQKEQDTSSGATTSPTPLPVAGGTPPSANP